MTDLLKEPKKYYVTCHVGKILTHHICFSEIWMIRWAFILHDMHASHHWNLIRFSLDRRWVYFGRLKTMTTAIVIK